MAQTRGSDLNFLALPSSGQPAGPGSQQASSPDYNAWVDLYRQPMAYFNQGAPQTQAPGLQVSSGSGSSRIGKMFFSQKSFRKIIQPLLFSPHLMCHWLQKSLKSLSLSFCFLSILELLVFLCDFVMPVDDACFSSHRIIRGRRPVERLESLGG